MNQEEYESEKARLKAIKQAAGDRLREYRTRPYKGMVDAEYSRLVDEYTAARDAVSDFIRNREVQ